MRASCGQKQTKETKKALGGAPDGTDEASVLPIAWILMVLCLVLTGCTFRRAAQGRVTAAVVSNRVKLDEEARALTTAVVDVLALAPTNRHVGLALDLAQHAQQIEGVPLLRMDVNALLAEQDAAWDALRVRYGRQNALLAQRASLAAKLRNAEAKLVEMGGLYEAERNRSIVSRTWHWAVATLGFGGIIALCVFFPFLIPIFGQIAAWLVAKIPALASFFGVVGKKAFDSVVRGVGDVREKFKASGNSGSLAAVDTSLAIATDADHKRLIESRRTALNV